MSPIRLAVAVLSLLAVTVVVAADKAVLYTDEFDTEGLQLRVVTANCEASYALPRGISSAPGLARSITYAFGKPAAFGLVKLVEPVKLDRLPQELSLDVLSDASNNVFMVELVDASGEQHQYKLGLLGWRGWQHLKMENLPSSQTSFYGGDENKRIDLPITQVTMSVRNYSPYGKARPNGKICIDNIRLFAPPSSAMAAPPPIARCLRSPHPVVLDGDLGEWDATAPITLSADTCAVIDQQPADATSQASAQVLLSQDDGHLYIAATVTDNRVVCPGSRLDIWPNDGLEVWLDCRHDSGSSLTGEDDYRLKFSPATAGDGPAAFHAWGEANVAHLMAATRVAAKRTPTGYTIEASLPKNALCGLGSSACAGLNLSLCDSSGEETCRLLWAGQQKTSPVDYGLLVLATNAPEKASETGRQQRERTRLRLLSASASDAYHGPPRLLTARQLTASPQQYGRFELAVQIAAEYSNPFDFADISLRAEFTGPDGGTQTIDGFYYQGYRFCFGKVTKEGEPEWRIRFCPTQAGDHRFRVLVADSQGRKAEGEWRSFRVAASEDHGFLRVSKRDPMYLAHDDGTSFYGIGYAAHEWNNKDLITKYEVTLNHLAAFGCNYTSVNFDTIANSGFGLCIQHLDRYSLENAWQFDFVLARAERRGLYLLPCLFQTKLATSKLWENNRYNTKRGGPCKTPGEFFSSPEVRRLSKNRLRYVLARWGYSPHILGWEIFNEVNYCAAAQEAPETVVDFLHDMGQFLKTTDPNRHLVSSSFGSGAALEMPAVWQLPEIDFTIIHSYTHDIASALAGRLAHKRAFGKPTLGGECGVSVPHALEVYRYDPDGLAVHNNLWASAFNGAAGNVLNWWHNRYQALDVGFHYRAFAGFAKGIAWDREELQPAELVAEATDPATASGDVTVPTEKEWRAPGKEPFTLLDSGLWTRLPESQAQATYVADADLNIRAEALPGMLFGTAHPHLAGDLVFQVECPGETAAELRLAAVSKTGAVLRIVVNGTALPDRPLADTDGLDNPDASELPPLTLPLRKGENTIVLANAGTGWFSLDQLIIKNLRPDASRRDIRVRALLGPRLKMGWIQQAQSTWYLQTLGEEIPPVGNCRVAIPAATPGNWTLEWWDTWHGKVFASSTIEHKGGQLQITIPKFERDVAFRLRRDE